MREPGDIVDARTHVQQAESNSDRSVVTPTSTPEPSAAAAAKSPSDPSAAAASKSRSDPSAAAAAKPRSRPSAKNESKQTTTVLRLARSATDHASDLVERVGPDGRFLYVNEAWCSRHGYSRRQALAMHVWDVDPALSPDAWPRAWERHRELGVFRMEAHHRARGGDVFAVEVLVFHVEYEGEENDFSFLCDIGERKRAEETLRASEERFRGIFEQGSFGVALVDPDQRLVRANPALCRMLGYKERELLGMTIAQITAPEDRQKSVKETQALFAGTLPFLTMDKRYLRKDGRTVWGHVSAAATRDAVGNAVGSVCIVQDITELKITEDSLRLTQLSVDSAVDLICWIDADGRLLYVNDAFCERHGYSRQELLNMTIFDVDPNLSPKMWPERWRQRKERGALAFESLHRTKEGEVFPVEVTTRIVERAGEEVNVGFARDLTERKTAEAALKESEEQLRQAQKMEALGQLAGGIAHDFNNLLTSIIGNSFLALAALSPEDPNYELIKDIKEVGERAAGLTRQILAFSRRQVLKPQVVYLNDILLQMEPLLRRTLGEDIDLRFVARPDLEKTEVDPHQMEQVLMNLALNARDAMPEGGSLIIETANVDLDVRYCKTHPEVKPGRYVALSVTDTGCGMDSETMSHIFEPFFTTKETGKGTGLGLSTAFGVVKQSGGAISVYSEPGRGTTFKVYLPVSGRAVAPQPDYQRETAPGRGKETILLVEDEAPVRHLFHRILADAGYNVLEVGSASEAQGLLDQTGAPPDLLLADVVLPGGKSGPELAEALLARYPGLAVIFMSGYTREAVLYNGHLDEKTEFLEKPFLPEVVLHKVRAVLDARAAKIQEPAEFGATREAANSAAPTRAVIARTEATAVCRVARHPAKAHRAARQRH